MDEIKGFVDHVIFRNDENGYTVFELDNDDGEIICIGTFNYIEEGLHMELSGSFVTHKLYGEQFSVQTYQVCKPEDIESIARYLYSGAIKGIGKTIADRIVKKFGEETFRIIEEEPERLVEIRGISERIARDIAFQMEEKKDMRSAMLFLQKYGVGAALSANLYQYYGEKLFTIIEENPYRLADDISGVGFKTADEIAAKIGILPNSDFRIESGICYILELSVRDGNIYLLLEDVIRKTEELLQIVIEEQDKHITALLLEKKIIVKNAEEGVRVYASLYYYMELRVAKKLLDLNISAAVDEELVRKRVAEITEDMGFELGELQKTAISDAMKSGVFILSGGPGTGKTTTLRAMIALFERENMEVSLAAPTGRAAKRMSEATGCKAQTIHRLLEVQGGAASEGRIIFNRNEQDPLEVDVLIIDEMSMVDLPLMNALLQAIEVGTRVIFVGDCNQLPSVGPGKILKDIIDSETFSSVILTEIFRQASGSDIVVNAHKIQRGEALSLDNKSEDFFFLKRDNPEKVIQVMLTLIVKKLPKYVGATAFDIQVLSPMRKGTLGVENLNKVLQMHLNPKDDKKPEIESHEHNYRQGDKVMQIKNNYDLIWKIRTERGLVIDEGLGIFNGDMGIITEIDNYADTLTVEFDEHRLVEYQMKQLEELEHAYAVTVHKSQGSEYPAVVIPLLSGPHQLYNRNLIYTAITRAKKCVTIVGSEEVLKNMVQNTTEQKRNTSLAERIVELDIQ